MRTLEGISGRDQSRVAWGKELSAMVPANAWIVAIGIAPPHVGQIANAIVTMRRGLRLRVPLV